MYELMIGWKKEKKNSNSCEDRAHPMERHGEGEKERERQKDTALYILCHIPLITRTEEEKMGQVYQT